MVCWKIGFCKFCLVRPSQLHIGRGYCVECEAAGVPDNASHLKECRDCNHRHVAALAHPRLWEGIYCLDDASMSPSRPKRALDEEEDDASMSPSRPKRALDEEDDDATPPSRRKRTLSADDDDALQQSRCKRALDEEDDDAQPQSRRKRTLSAEDEE